MGGQTAIGYLDIGPLLSHADIRIPYFIKYQVSCRYSAERALSPQTSYAQLELTDERLRDISKNQDPLVLNLVDLVIYFVNTKPL